MLYIDNDCITAQDLQAVDSECVDVATSQNPPIAMEGERSVIRRSIEKCGSEISAMNQTMSGYFVSSGMGLNHVMAVMNVGGFGIERPRFQLSALVTKDPDPTKRDFKFWIENVALQYLYRDCVTRAGTNNDRYAAKMEIYKEEAEGTLARLQSRGFPILIGGYLPCPAALRDYNAGTFDQTNLSATGSGSAETGNNYNVAITYVGSAYVSQTAKKNSESGPSATYTVTVPATQLIHLDITSLIPPDGSAPDLGSADGVSQRMKAAGWNVYVGLSNQPLRLQNASPIAIATKTYTLAAVPTTTGSVMGLGQYSDTNIVYAPLFKRG